MQDSTQKRKGAKAQNTLTHYNLLTLSWLIEVTREIAGDTQKDV